MSMMSGLSDLEGTALAKVLRRTIVSALIGGGGAIIIALLLSAPWAALGIVIGLAMAKKAVRRAMGTKSVTRLAVITVIAIGLMFVNGALGIGTVTGLVIFQLFFVVNVGRVLVSQGLQ